VLVDARSAVCRFCGTILSLNPNLPWISHNAMTGTREGFTVRIQRSGSAVPAGVGFVVDDTHIITCAHVVNTAMGRDQRAQEKPDPRVRIEVEFPMLGDASGGPSRSCAVQAWAPPPASGASGGDIAGLVLVGEGLPALAGPARITNSTAVRDVMTGVFGYPGDPPRQTNGAWAELRLRGAVGGGVIQLDGDSGSAIRAQPGYSGSPIVVATEDGDAVLGMLAAVSSNGEARDAYAIPVSELARAWPDVVGRLTIPPCPYRGLGSFTADDAELFFGRADEVSRLREMVTEQPVVIVTGPSGVGKSSLVNAGLIPQLREQGWAVGGFRPGGTPVDALAAALALVQMPGKRLTVTEVANWASLIRSEGLARAGARLAVALGQPVLLHVDQLEEILVPGGCPQDLRDDFLEMLLSAQAAPENGLHLVATLRGDFWNQLLEHPDAGTRLSSRWFGLSPMGKDRLEKVIAEPALSRGVYYQEGLVRAIAEDAGGGHGLPLLEFALTQLWPHQQKGEITWVNYHGIGGVAGALNRHAEYAYHDLLGRYPEARIGRVMLALVRSRGGAAEAIRRVVPRDQFGEHWDVVQALVQQRLLVVGRDESTGEQVAEIGHEALIREWPRFASWVNDDADFQHWLISMEERAGDGELLPDTRLAEADRWLAEREADVPLKVKEFVQDSKSEWLKRVTELENARNRAEARRLATAAELALTSSGTPLHIPIALAIEAMKMAPVLEAEVATRRAIRTAASQVFRLDHDGIVSAVAFSPDGTRLATASDDGRARVFDTATGSEICRVTQDARVHAVAFSPDGKWIVTGSSGLPSGGARVFNSTTGAEVVRLNDDGDVSAVAFSPDGTKVAVGSRRLFSGGGGARVFEAASGAEIGRLNHDGHVSLVVFSPDGTRVATGSTKWLSEGGGVRVFNATTCAEVARLDHDGDISALAFSPDGSRIVTGGGVQSGGSAQVFDAATGIEITRMRHHNRVVTVAFSPDGTRVATGSSNLLNVGARTRVFYATSGEETAQLSHDGDVSVVTFSPDGTRVATASGSRSGGSARVFDAANGTEIARLDHDDRVNAVAFSPDGSMVATGSSDCSARIFQAASGAAIKCPAPSATIHKMAFSPDDTWLTADSFGHKWVYDATTGAEVIRLERHGTASAVAFSGEGIRLAVPGKDCIVVSDGMTGKEAARLDRDSAVCAIAFSPDGTRIVVGSKDTGARIFDASNGAEIASLDHDGFLGVETFSKNGSRVATRSRTRILVSDTVTGERVAQIEGNISAIAFSPDGTRIAVGTKDTGVHPLGRQQPGGRGGVQPRRNPRGHQKRQ
jgi:WD40 repeat protein